MVEKNGVWTVLRVGVLLISIGVASSMLYPPEPVNTLSGEFSAISVFYEQEQIFRTIGTLYTNIPNNDTLEVDWQVNESFGCQAVTLWDCSLSTPNKLCLQCVG